MRFKNKDILFFHFIYIFLRYKPVIYLYAEI